MPLVSTEAVRMCRKCNQGNSEDATNVYVVVGPCMRNLPPFPGPIDARLVDDETKMTTQMEGPFDYTATGALGDKRKTMLRNELHLRVNNK